MPEPEHGAEPEASVEEHLARVLAAVSPLPAFPQPLMDALGLAVAEDVEATSPLPGFDAAAMDGYAVRAVDVAHAGDPDPAVLPVVGEVAAGRATLTATAPGTAVRIMTGGRMPVGTDTVVPQEWTDRGAAQVRISRSPEPGQHVRLRGEDVEPGDLLVEEGTVLGPRHLGLLAAAGRAAVRVRPRPRVVVLSTGSELREVGSQLGHDSVFDANSFLLAAAARRAGALAYRVGIVPDDPRAFTEALSDQLVRADLVVTTGGIGEGDHDVVKEALEGGRAARSGALPGEVHFGSVALQPGRPQGLGQVGEDRVPLLALPGNPVAAYVSCEVFVLPAIRRLMGVVPYARPTVRARLTHGVQVRAGRRQYLRAEHAEEHGVARVTPLQGRGSHLVGDLAAANALVVVPEETTHVEAGQAVDVLLLDQEAW
ncbi:gephyrin-like molybdotransferase Glp [Nocardioides perillae]|uniref:Molybdopterin molybdenumtransferase n=1 Tax=Nocardioides perillae TaxID=1119534 RepID=A0A7Y9RXA0_9ACTN|nr:gephyrin-like molybdotransferase Glp [Nocardioides perillae]NYG56989.1 molybdopterin molybdotransferase [Nocardioides perillae]